MRMEMRVETICVRARISPKAPNVNDAGEARDIVVVEERVRVALRSQCWSTKSRQGPEEN